MAELELRIDLLNDQPFLELTRRGYMVVRCAENLLLELTEDSEASIKLRYAIADFKCWFEEDHSRHDHSR